MPIIEQATAPLAVRLFGKIDVTVDGKPLPRMRSRKEILLLALLCLSREKSKSRPQIAQTLWPYPDFLETQAHQYLRRSLYELRKALGSAASLLSTDSDNTLGLDTSAAYIDVAAFDRLLATEDPSCYQQAVDLYSAPLLAEYTDEWIASERELRMQALLKACRRIAEHNVRTGDYPAAVGVLRTALTHDPSSESTCRDLMHLLSDAGDRTAAIDIYQDLCRNLSRRFHSTPDTQTTELYNKLRRDARIGSGAAMAQITAAASSDLASGVTTSPMPHPITTLIGREHESTALGDVLQTSRLVTLVGVGGVGKTRLSIAVGEEVERRTGRAVVFADLSSVTASEDVLATIAAVLGVRAPDDASIRRSIETLIGPGSVLIILDNCEHLVSACAEVSQMLLSRCAGLRILATSRQSLGVIGEYIWEVQPLPVPDPDTLPLSPSSQLAMLSSYSSIALFVDRARSVDKQFAVTQRNAIAIARICKLVDGIPLGVELAAAQIMSLSPEQLAERLGNQMSVLTLGSRAAAPRQKTLRTLIDWSYNLLTPEERSVVSALSVFRGGCDLDAAEAVCASSQVSRQDVAGILRELYAKSLIKVEHRGALPPRYSVLEPIREYGLSQLAQIDPENRTACDHALWFYQVSKEASRHLKGSNQLRFLQKLDAERDNLHAALEWFANDREHRDTLVEMVHELWHYWEMRGQISAGRQQLIRALAVCPDADPKLLAKVTGAASYFADFQADQADKLRLSELALALSEKTDDPEAHTIAEHFAGWAYRAIDSDKSMSLLEQSVASARRLGDPWHIASALEAYSFTVTYRGDPERGGDLLDEALAHAQRTSDIWLSGSIDFSMGWLYLLKGEYAKARAMLLTSLSIQEKLNDQQFIGSVLLLLAATECRDAEFAAAFSFAQRSLKLKWTCGNARGIAAVLEVLAFIALSTERYRTCVWICSGVQRHFPDVDSPFKQLLPETPVKMLEQCERIMEEREFFAAETTGRSTDLKELVIRACSEE